MNQVVKKNSPEYEDLLRPFAPAGSAARAPKAAVRSSAVGGTSAPHGSVVRASEVRRRSSASRRRTPEAAAALRRKLLMAGLSALLCAGLCVGNLFIADIRSDWYHELAKPFFCPPLAALYAAYVVSIVLFSVTYALVLTRGKALIIRFEFLFNSLLQVLWAVFFFRIRAIFASLIILALLVLHTFFLLKFTRRHVGNLAFLLLAHLVRVAFSILLNYSILVLN